MRYSETKNTHFLLELNAFVRISIKLLHVTTCQIFALMTFNYISRLYYSFLFLAVCDLFSHLRIDLSQYAMEIGKSLSRKLL